MDNNIHNGFITIAFGECYCKLAEHLYMTYKLYGNCSAPFYVITNEEGEKHLNKIFDGVIINNSVTNTSVDKMCVFTLSPFEKTVFLDSDCSVVNDINYIFDEFEKNGSDVSAIADVKELNNQNCGIQFGNEAIVAFNIKYDFPSFNGGVYYYEKSELGIDCVNFMMNELLPHYHDYKLLGRNNSTNMGDEPIVIVGMLKYNMKPLPSSSNIMYLVQNPNDVVWDMKKRTCVFQWYEYSVSPSIIHWKVGGTETYRYEKYDTVVRGKYNKSCFLKILLNQVIVFIKYKIYPQILKWFPQLHKIVNKIKG